MLGQDKKQKQKQSKERKVQCQLELKQEQKRDRRAAAEDQSEVLGDQGDPNFAGSCWVGETAAFLADVKVPGRDEAMRTVRERSAAQ